MVQVLPQAPSFGERLVPYLHDLGVSAGTYMKKKWDRTAFENEMEKFNSKNKSKDGSQDNSESKENSFETPMDKMNQVQNETDPGYDPSALFSLYRKASTYLGPKDADALLKTYIEKSKLAEKEGQEIRKEDRALVNKSN